MKLYYFTNSFPYGLGEQWKYQELEIIKDYFSEIVVIPLSYGGNFDNPRILDNKIKVLEPLFESELGSAGWRDVLKSTMSSPGIIFGELVAKKLYRSKSRLGKALGSLSNAQRILRHSAFKKLIAESTTETYWFFYWGRGVADVIPFLPVFRNRKIAVRLHRYDIFESENDNYIPFRRAFYRRVDAIFSVSEYGKAYLQKHYPQYGWKVIVARLGTKSIGLSSPSKAAPFSIVSCSNLVPVKRVNLIVEALQQIEDTKIKWTHIGSGPLLGVLKEEFMRLPNNIDVKFVGNVHPSNVLDIYTSESFDLFINVSESEGVPVSIMEALSAGIPILATAAGGTVEIVDDLVGRVIDVDSTAEQIAGNIAHFIKLPNEKRQELRANAFLKYEERCNMEKNTMAFIEKLIG